MSIEKRLVSQRYRHPELGVIHIVVRANARSFIARWKNNELSITVPERTTIETYNRILDEMKPRLLEKKPAGRFFYAGQTFESALHRFVVEAGHDLAYHRILEPEKKLVRLIMSVRTPAEGEEAFNRFVNNQLNEYATYFSTPFLIDEAADLAVKLGVTPRYFAISRGVRVLGKCYADRHIELSRNLIFYPEEHRRYVYAHELAHLTHMDHSPAFHALLDHYLDGRERELKAASDAFRIPIIT